MIAERLKTVSWSKDCHPTGVVKPVYWIPILPLTANTVPSRGHNTTPTLNKIYAVKILVHFLNTILPGHASQTNVLFWMRPRDIPISFLSRDMSWNAWNRYWGSSMVYTWILLNNMKPLSCLLYDILELKHRQWPNRLYTNSLPCCRTWPFTEYAREFHILVLLVFVRGVVCRQGTLTPPYTWSRHIWYLHVFYSLITVFFPDLWFFWLCASNFHRYLDVTMNCTIMAFLNIDYITIIISLDIFDILLYYYICFCTTLLLPLRFGWLLVLSH